MAEITARRVGELVRGVFQILTAHPDGLAARDVLTELEQIVPPTEFEDSTYPKNPAVRRYGKIVRFSTIGPVKAGWLVKEKGAWTLTESGEEAYRKFTDPEEFTQESKRLYKVWKKTQPIDLGGGENGGPDPTTTLEEAEEAAWAAIKEHLETMNPFDFQDLVAGLIRAMDYYVSWVSPPGPDRGIDILAHTDPLGIEGPRIKVQVKRRADKIAVDGTRSFMAVLGDDDVGIFVSTGGFTKDAEKEIRAQEKRRMMLIDLEALFDLWIEHYDELSEEKRGLLPLRPVYYLAPSE